jgi:hypothetical protein
VQPATKSGRFFALSGPVFALRRMGSTLTFSCTWESRQRQPSLGGGAQSPRVLDHGVCPCWDSRAAEGFRWSGMFFVWGYSIGKEVRSWRKKWSFWTGKCECPAQNETEKKGGETR